MNLADYVHKGSIKGPKVIGIYAEVGVGKSSAISELPNVWFIRTEDNHHGVNDNANLLPLCSTWEEVVGWHKMLLEDKELPCDNICIDSISSLASIIEKKICSEEGAKSITKVNYGNGPTMVADYIDELIDIWAQLKKEKNANIFWTCHTEVKKKPNPEGEPYDSYRPKLHDKAINKLNEKSNAIFFARIKEKAVEKEKVFGQKRYKGTGNGERVILTDSRPAYLAKCTCKHMPLEMPMDLNLIIDFWDNPENYQEQTA